MSSSTSRRSELKRAFREKPPPAGVFAVRCKASGRICIGSALNAQGAINRIQFELKQRMHRTFTGLQEEFDRCGAEGFTFEVLDVLPPSEDPSADSKDELAVLEALWRERLRS
jgi:hypothetical protein